MIRNRRNGWGTSWGSPVSNLRSREKGNGEGQNGEDLVIKSLADYQNVGLGDVAEKLAIYGEVARKVPNC